MSCHHSRPARRSRRAPAARDAAALAGAAVPVLAGGASGAGPETASVAGTAPYAAAEPTEELVHGARAGSSGWAPATDRLQTQGCSVQVPADPLRGLAPYAAHVKSRIESIDDPVVPVGHACDSTVIS
ncbi:hypothetical protein ABZ172_23015 [Streptomyces sp. NPDC006296]|uniref:hypothetical protein n=1 Tax=Streptomyces sp. NPDC006296 TaxID=3156746 RepID=UPI0033BD76B4